MSNWLDNLTTLPDLRLAGAKKPEKSSSPKKPRKLKGETHTFHNFPSITKEQYKKSHPRYHTGEAILPVFRKYLIRELSKAKYSPSHTLGLSPYWPEHNLINWEI